MKDNNIDILIEKASHSKSDEDYNSFFNNIRGEELFFNLLKSDNVQNTNGGTKIPIASIGENIQAVVFYTSATDSRLSDKYAGIVWEKGLEMVSKMGSVNGVVIQGEADAWIAITKEKIDELLSRYKNPRGRTNATT